ncbi:hypothetical protein [Alkalihalobacterium chitinilyticum]|uniref:Phr family secreted Rap phosphatase inhibitor n=1 Tax=Alkalihalobacterium chitinilyticum TaxID=2980103 RepID=A0ABT5VMX5_9BACI|nr:hypothetical protein [Alkalihalobacterium chitinilyticum]MDE5415619.1 hypothetical protein [Alkalihalobacterium chitinilyticum]
MKKFLLHCMAGLAILVGLTGFSYTGAELDSTAIKVQEDLPHRH